MPDLLTVAEVAALLQLNQQTVRNWIDSGSLAAVHVGRRVRIQRTDVEAMVGSVDPEIPNNDLLTVAEVASILRVSQQSVRNWIGDGRLQAVRVGRRVRIRRENLQGLMSVDKNPRAGVDTQVHSATDFWEGSKPVGETVLSFEP